MIRNTMAVLALLLGMAGGAQANCVILDRVEIGDTGPASARVCEMLERRFPNALLEVRDREILSADRVSVIVAVDGRTQAIDYRLVGWDWVQPTQQFAQMR